MRIVDELQHLDGIKGNFMVSESEYVAPLILFEHGKIAPQAVYSNISEIVEQQQYIFDNFWNKSIPAEERIKEIEEGTTLRIGMLLHTEEKRPKAVSRNFSLIKWLCSCIDFLDSVLLIQDGQH
jgi:hypothetical protein